MQGQILHLIVSLVGRQLQDRRTSRLTADASGQSHMAKSVRKSLLFGQLQATELNLAAHQSAGLCTAVRNLSSTLASVVCGTAQSNIEIADRRNQHRQRREAIGNANPEADAQVTTQQKVGDGVERQKWQHDGCQR